MKLKSYEQIMAASKPEEIFTMNPSTLKEEFSCYCEMYKPDQKFHEIRNFVVTQQLKLLFRKASAILKDIDNKDNVPYRDDNSIITLYTSDNNIVNFEYDSFINQRICETYSNDSQILMVINSEYEERFGFVSNFLEKVQSYLDFWKGKNSDWNEYQYAVPDIVSYFKTKDKSKYAILLQKPCKIYPLREVLDYFGGRMNAKHVISIVKRLYLHACYIDIADMTHNAICIDNIFFSPGNEVMPGQKYSVEDIRIVGLYGGWFFTTSKDEIVKAFPREVCDCIPSSVKVHSHSSFDVDMLSIKKVARELLGDVTGRNLFEVDSKLCEWFNRTSCANNAHDEFEEFERICQEVYGKPRFVNIDVSI